MKNLVFKNMDLNPLFELVDSIVISSGTAKRGKGKLLKKIKESFEEMQADQKELYKEFFELNEDGSIKLDKKGKFITLEGKTTEEANEKNKELMEEPVVIELVTFEAKIKAFYKTINEDDFTIASGRETNDVVFDTLMEALDEVFEGGE